MGVKTMTLKEWINERGTEKVAQLLNVNQSTVRHWRLGNNIPRPEQMKEIKRLSKGQVTYDEMIETHLKSGK